MKALLKNYRGSPRKIRLVLHVIRGKSVEAAENILRTLPKRASLPVLKILKSAVANAKDKENLYVKSATADKGIVFKRFMPRAFGRASAIHKRTSHVKIVLIKKEKK